MSVFAVDRRLRTTRIVLAVVGALVMGLGAWIMLDTVQPKKIWGLVTWLVAAVILHDVVLSPFVALVGVMLRRSGRVLQRWVLVVVQAAVVLGSVLALIVLPEIAAKHHGQRNLTVVPFDYVTRLLVVEGVLALVVLVVLVIGWRTARRR